MPQSLICPWLTVMALGRFGFIRYGSVSDGVAPIFEIEADRDEYRQATNCVYAFVFDGVAVRVGQATLMGRRMDYYQRHVTARLNNFHAGREVQTTLREALGWWNLLERHEEGEVYFKDGRFNRRKLETKLITAHTLPLNWTRW